MDELVRKRGRPLKVGSKRRRMEIRLSDSEYMMLDELSRVTGKSFTDILVRGLRKQYDECLEYEYYDYDFD